MVVFPIPWIPVNRYAEAILSLAIALLRKAIAFSWPIISLNDRARMGTFVLVVFTLLVVFRSQVNGERLFPLSFVPPGLQAVWNL